MPSMAPLARFPAFTRPFLVSSSMLAWFIEACAGIVRNRSRSTASLPFQYRRSWCPYEATLPSSTTPLFTFVLWSLSGVDASPEWSHLFSGDQSTRPRCGVVLINSQPAAESTTAFHIPVASRSHIAI